MVRISMTPAETLAIYIALIGIPVFVAVLACACGVAAKRGDAQREREQHCEIQARRVRRLREREPV